VSDSFSALTADTLRATIAFMWLWSALAKVRSFPKFADSAQVLLRPLIPQVTHLLAHIIPLIELGLAVTLLLDRSAVIAEFVSAILLAVFAVILLRGWLLHADISCHCFGASNDDDRITGFSVGRTVLLALLAMVALVTSVSSHQSLYTSGHASLGIFLLAGLFVTGSVLIGTSVRLLSQVEKKILMEAARR
jgi:uncharacterized membrane protein YphA (DoxX/SURF4 family)